MLERSVLVYFVFILEGKCRKSNKGRKLSRLLKRNELNPRRRLFEFSHLANEAHLLSVREEIESCQDCG